MRRALRLYGPGGDEGFAQVPRSGYGEFVDRVVPLPRRCGAFGTEYAGATPRSQRGLVAPVGKG